MDPKQRADTMSRRAGPSTSPAKIPQPGELMSERYRIVRQLGEGAMGVVLHAKDEQLEREVAIKLVRAEWARDRQSAEAFLQEARAMARVSHDNVVKIYDFGWYDSGPYFVMEYIEGVDLLDWLHARLSNPPTVDEALGIVNEICRGVQAIHEAGAIHRDLKPSNVMVGPGHRIVVTDLGLASLLGSDEELAAAGSPGYVAPEVIAGKHLSREMWPRLDIYALGIIAYELLTQEAAFWAETGEDVMKLQVSTDPRPIHEARPDVDRSLDAVIRLALNRDPEQRIGSVDVFRRSLIEARRRAADPKAGRRIVVADDDPTVRKYIEKLLTREFPGVEVTCVDNGQDALASVMGMRTSLLITDLRMPGLTGEELVQQIRANARMYGVAVLVLTGEGGSKEWDRLREMGADGCLLKPVDAVPFLALVKSLLEKPLRNRNNPGASGEDRTGRRY